MMIKVAVSDCFKLKMIPSFRSVFFPEKQEIHYIGGTDILPLPLSSEEEGHAISLLGGGQDEEGKKLLIEHNLRLVVYIAKKFDNTGVGVEDLISIGTIGLIKAINTFNPEKNIKLATYASRCIENEILMYLRRNNKTKLEVSIDEPLNVDWDGNELLLSDILGTEEDTIYRIVQEGITNAIRHGHASRIFINFKKVDIWLVIRIRDNGIGCKDIHKGFGLTHMKERVDMLHGTVTYSSNNGFQVVAKLPIRWRNEER